jgi:hypothetical protein
MNAAITHQPIKFVVAVPRWVKSSCALNAPIQTINRWIVNI